MTTEQSPNARITWLVIAGGVFVVVSVFLLVWVPYQRQMWLIEEIEAVGGTVDTDSEEVGPDWLREFVGYERMRGIYSIHYVDLEDAPIDDAWLKKLRRLTSLRELNLLGAPIGDEGLEHLAGLTNLEELSLEDTQISDYGLIHLIELPKLERLSLDLTDISDESLQYLAGLPRLKDLSLFYTRISEDGLKELQQAMPKCKIGRF